METLRICLLVWAAIALAMPLVAEDVNPPKPAPATGRITGTVTDVNNRIPSHSTVVLEGPVTGGPHTVVLNDNGFFGAGSLTHAQRTAETGSGQLSAAETSADRQPQTAAKPASPGPAVALDNGWHLVASPYLWLAGAHGTVGVLGHQASFHATAGDLLSHFRFGLMGTVDARFKRLVLPLDVMWIRLADDKALPFPNIEATSADVKLTEFILTPRIGYRVLDCEKFKIDGLTGFRYWHIGQNLEVSPSRAGLNFSGSHNWVDVLAGGRVLATLSPKVELTVAGDVGGWGAAAELDYQVVGAIGYRIKPNWTMQAGYRQLYVDYRTGGSLVQFTTSGTIIGVSINLK